jgi:hypothetical protein
MGVRPYFRFERFGWESGVGLNCNVGRGETECPEIAAEELELGEKGERVLNDWGWKPYNDARQEVTQG